MKKNLSVAALLLAVSTNAFAQTSAKDSLRVVNLQEVQIVSTRATSKTPVAYSNISKNLSNNSVEKQLSKTYSYITEKTTIKQC